METYKYSNKTHIPFSNIIWGECLNIDDELGVSAVVGAEDMKKNQILKEHGNVIKQYRDKDGGYYYHFRIPDKTQKSGYYRKKAKHREDIEKKLVQYYLELEKKEQEEDNRTLESVFYECMEYKKTKRKPETIRRAIADWKKFYEPQPEFIHKNIKEINGIDVDNFFSKVLENKPLKNKAFKNLSGLLKQTFGYAVDMNYIDKSPYRIRINEKQIIYAGRKSNEQSVFFPKEQEKLIEEMERMLSANPKTITPLAVELNFQLGLRVGELMALRYSDIENDFIHIQRQYVVHTDATDTKNPRKSGYDIVDHTKSKKGDRLIPLTEEAKRLIERIRSANEQNNNICEDFLFVYRGKVIQPKSVEDRIGKGCKNIGIPVRKCHCIRKTFASTLYTQGVPVQTISRLLGHEDITTTLTNYIFGLCTNEEEKEMVLNALQGNGKGNGNTTFSNKKAETVTPSDKKIIQFPLQKKRKKLAN